MSKIMVSLALRLFRSFLILAHLFVGSAGLICRRNSLNQDGFTKTM